MSSFTLLSQRLLTSTTRRIGTTAPFQNVNLVTRSYAYGSSGESSGEKNTLSKPDLARMLAEEHDLSIAQSNRILNSVFDIISEVSKHKKYIFYFYDCADFLFITLNKYLLHPKGSS